MENKERQPLKTNPMGQAHDQLRGYYYQILHSVDAWVDLADDEILYLECEDDFGVVSVDIHKAVRVKDTKHNISLNCWR